MMKRVFILGFALVVTWAQAGVIRGDSKESLRGLSGVYVVSQLVDSAPEGITTNVITQMVATRLRDVGIPVYKEPKASDGDANFCITLDALKDPQNGVYIFTVRAALSQNVRMARLVNPHVVSSETWARDLQGMTTLDRVDIIRDAIQKVTDPFIKDFQEVNPKPNGAKR